MSATRTIEIFAYYLVFLGACIVFAPGLTTALILLPPPADDDYLFVGFLLWLLAYYYWRMARAGNTAFFQVSVVGRLGVFAATILWVIFGTLAPNYLAVVLIDVAGALWTARALKTEGQPAFTLT